MQYKYKTNKTLIGNVIIIFKCLNVISNTK